MLRAGTRLGSDEALPAEAILPRLRAADGLPAPGRMSWLQPRHHRSARPQTRSQRLWLLVPTRGRQLLLACGRRRLARAGLAEPHLFQSASALTPIGLFIGLGIGVGPLWLLPLVVLLPLWLFILSFFRDPERVIPTDPDVLVSPADGVVTHLEEVDAPDFPGGKALRVSIFLSVFNVHVNRVPRSGRVTGIGYYPGEYLDARVGDCPVRNEQLQVDIEDERLKCPVRVKQIAGAIARRIVCWLKPGETVRAGERFGMIKFGSRTDVLVPTSVVAEVKVRVGDAVKGGSRVLMRLRSPLP